MSRVGNKVITLPAKVVVKHDGSKVEVEGPKGNLSHVLPEGISLTMEGENITVKRSSDERRQRALHGTSQRLLTNMIKGVSDGFTRDLEIHGTGFRAAVKGTAEVLGHDINEFGAMRDLNNDGDFLDANEDMTSGAFHAMLTGEGLHMREAISQRHPDPRWCTTAPRPPSPSTPAPSA
jgi:hypothetical protein